MSPCVIGIDVGTTGVKGIALHEDGQILETAYHEHNLSCPHPRWAEENPQDWWEGAVVVLRSLIGRIQSVPIAAVGVSGMVPALVLLDDDMHPLRPSIQQNDARTDGEMAWLRERIDEETFLSITGCAITQQLIPTKIRWLRNNEPRIIPQIRWMMGSYDYINYRLTGMCSLEQNWAIESGLWMAAERRWYQTMLDLFEIPQTWLPPVHAPHDIIGISTAEVEKQTGLSRGTPVIAGSADHIAAALASGISDSGDLVLKFGGAGDILYCLDQFAPHLSLFIDYHDLPGKYVINGCMAASGSIVKWFKNLLGGRQSSYAALDKGASLVSSGSDGLVVLPYFLGEKTPIFDPLARGVVFGLGLHHTKYHLHRAILEAVVYGFRHHAELIRDMGYPIRKVLAVDQGARSAVWRQIAADILGADIHRVQGGDMGSVYGTAFVAGVAARFWSWEDLPRFTHVRIANHPNPENHRMYDQMYPLYRDLYRHLKEDFKQLHKIQG
jgi:xylulokinase